MQALMEQKPTSSSNIVGAELKSKENLKIPEPKVNNLVVGIPSSSALQSSNNPVTVARKEFVG